MMRPPHDDRFLSTGSSGRSTGAEPVPDEGGADRHRARVRGSRPLRRPIAPFLASAVASSSATPPKREIEIPGRAEGAPVVRSA